MIKISDCKRIGKACLYCGKIVRTNRKDFKFCSQDCYHNNKIKNRILCYCDYCGAELHLTNKDYNRSKKHFCNKTCSGNYHKGNKNPSYNKKLTEEDRKNRRRIEGYGKWRKQVFQRDNYTCQISGQTDVEIIAHHLNGYDWDKKHRTDINNGITLSKEIHDLFHKNYGYGNNTKEQFEEFKQRYYNGEFN